MYDRKKFAVNALLGMFIRLVGTQSKKVFFDEGGLLELSPDNTSPVYVSTEDIVNISYLLDNVRHSPGWHKKSIARVHSLASAAEQYDYSDDDHLLHTMMRLYYESMYEDLGSLDARKRDGEMTVSLIDDNGVPALPWLPKTPMYDEDGKTESYNIDRVAIRYDNESGWQLFFHGTRLSDNKDSEISGRNISSGAKYEIAEWLIEKAGQEMSDYSTLEKITDDKWIATCKGAVEIDGIKFGTAIAVQDGCNVLSVEVGTTGYKGGDTGHGGRTFLRISDQASTDMRCIVCSDGKLHFFNNTCGTQQIEIMFGGDSELDTFIGALEFAADVLKKQRAGLLKIDVPEKNDVSE